jgi:hypothetical protein
MSQDQHPAHSPEREALRDRHGVRAVTSAEEGNDVKSLPAGVYGFTGAPAAPELPLFTHPIVRGTEVHKSANGEIYLIGYVQPSEKQAIESEAEPVHVNLFPEPRGESAALIAVPMPRIDRRQPPTRQDGNPMALEIAPRD